MSKEGVYVQFISSCVYMFFFFFLKLKKLKKCTICLAVPSLSCVMWDLLLQCVDSGCGAQAPDCAGR